MLHGTTNRFGFGQFPSVRHDDPRQSTSPPKFFETSSILRKSLCHTLQPQPSRTVPCLPVRHEPASRTQPCITLLVYITRRVLVSLLNAGCHLNQTRSFSYSYISPNQTRLPRTLRFNPAPQTPAFLRSILH